MKHPTVGEFEVILSLGVERCVPTDVNDVEVVEQHVDVNQDSWVAGKRESYHHEEEAHRQKLDHVENTEE